MKLQFVDSFYTPLPATVDIGSGNSVVVGLTIDPQGDTQPTTGNLLRNTAKIGEYSWSPANGTVITWYAGEFRPIYVNDKDTIKAQTLTPAPATITLTIKRTMPVLTGIKNLAKVVELLKPMVPTSKPHNRIRAAIDLVRQNAQVEYSQRTPINILNIRSYFDNKLDLPPTDAFIYGNATDLNNALATNTPPTQRQIFDEWDRFAADGYWTKNDTIPEGNAAGAWYWDDTLQAAYMPINTGLSWNGFNGFLSDEFVEYYDHDVTFTSPDNDDDFNGVVMAFKRVGNKNHVLAIQACNDANQSASTDPPAANLSVRYNYTKILAVAQANDVKGGWRGKTKRIKVTRRGDQFTVYASNWSEPDFNPALTISINLGDDPVMSIFRGPCKYGYCNASQPKSSFGKITYLGGILRDIIVDGANNRVYRYIPGSGWQLIPGVTAQTVFGSPRVLTNPDDGKRYQLNLNGTITKLN